MYIRTKLIWLFSLIIIPSIVFTSYFTFYYVESNIIENELNRMQSVIDKLDFEIENFHFQTQSDLLFAIQNPIFNDYFELYDFKNTNLLIDEIPQLTKEEKELQTKIENWLLQFHNKIQVDTTSLIDKNGHEHVRIVLGHVISDESLMYDLSNQPYFDYSFDKSRNDVHIQYPFVSTNTNRPVFAYSSPLVLENNEKPAIFYAEVPVSLIQSLVETNDGRLIIIDPNGFVVADSASNFDSISLNENSNIFPQISSVFTDIKSQEVMNKIFEEKEGIETFTKNNERFWIVYKQLPTFGWILLYEKPYSLMLGNEADFIEIQNTSVLIAAVLLLGGLAGTVYVSFLVSKPINKLAAECIKIEKDRKLSQIIIKSNDETKHVAAVINSLLKKVSQEERISAIGELGARLAHDMRNPLSVIKNNIELIKRMVTNSSDKKIAEFSRINRAVSRMSHQVDEVLEYVKDRPLELEKINLSKFLPEIIEDFMPYNISVEQSPNIEFKVDSKQLEILLVNLISNAIQASGDCGKIEIKIKDTSKEIIFQVQDSGPGISEEDMPKIFDLLYTTKQQGTGLGLASCKRIVESHGGKITVKNNPTTFEFSLPKNL